jgi:F5/8 type C domain-containing protein
MRTFYTLCLIVLCTLFSTGAASQCDTLRHNSTWFDGWISCEETANPNAARGNGHWILYDFNQVYTMFEMRVWNTNAPDILDYGMKNVVIDISDDGTTWTEFGQFLFPQGSGDSRYEGVDAMNFDSTNARYVLITGIDNYGGSCFGLSEVRIRARDLCPQDKIQWIAGDGTWDIPANWCSNRVPNQDDDVIIPSGVIVTIPFLYTAHAWNITLEPSAELEMIGSMILHKPQ